MVHAVPEGPSTGSSGSCASSPRRGGRSPGACRARRASACVIAADEPRHRERLVRGRLVPAVDDVRDLDAARGFDLALVVVGRHERLVQQQYFAIAGARSSRRRETTGAGGFALVGVSRSSSFIMDFCFETRRSFFAAARGATAAWRKPTRRAAELDRSWVVTDGTRPRKRRSSPSRARAPRAIESRELDARRRPERPRVASCSTRPGRPHFETSPILAAAEREAGIFSAKRISLRSAESTVASLGPAEADDDETTGGGSQAVISPRRGDTLCSPSRSSRRSPRPRSSTSRRARRVQAAPPKDGGWLREWVDGPRARARRGRRAARLGRDRRARGRRARRAAASCRRAIYRERDELRALGSRSARHGRDLGAWVREAGPDARRALGGPRPRRPRGRRALRPRADRTTSSSAPRAPAAASGRPVAEHDQRQRGRRRRPRRRPARGRRGPRSLGGGGARAGRAPACSSASFARSRLSSRTSRARAAGPASGGPGHDARR